MKFMVLYSVSAEPRNADWGTPERITRFARAVEAAGLDALAFTDHPAPSQRWLDAGGHESFDPFTALSFVAGVTEHLRLMTYLAVVPYRNPLLLWKSMASVDVLSGGRTTFVLGVGYLRAEFAALGIDFDERNELFDEAMTVIEELRQGEAVHVRGKHFEAQGVVSKPDPVQKPSPPMWIGGNGKIVRGRVARWGQGWAPQIVTKQVERMARTAPIATDDQLAAHIREIGDRMEELERDRSQLDVSTTGTRPVGLAASAEQNLDYIGQLSAIGVTWMPLYLDHGSYDEVLERIAWFGEAVVARTR